MAEKKNESVKKKFNLFWFKSFLNDKEKFRICQNF